ncbi:nuclear pore complex protein NUP98A-like [Apium graveolens]|uniref:nuclear pore complex protein NUP98A-like n=1 Tax=Apium graveolens TaxID=4045 RepID=UPI003D7A4506
MAETPPVVPHMLVKGPKTAPVRYGISSIPIKHSAEEKQHQLLKTNWNRKDDGLVVSSSSDAQGTTTTSRKKASLVSKHNLGVLVSGPCEEWNLRIDLENIFYIKHKAIHVYENGEVSVPFSKPLGDGSMQNKVGIPGETFASEHSLKSSPVNGNYSFGREVSSDASLLPKLKDSDYLIQPPIEKLAITESFDPGFCSHVKDFVVGHQYYGRIKFLGETDVQHLDVNSHIVFRNRKVIIPMDENKKPPFGQGLNKAAKIYKYRKKLIKKAAEHGAEVDGPGGTLDNFEVLNLNIEVSWILKTYKYSLSKQSSEMDKNFFNIKEVCKRSSLEWAIAYNADFCIAIPSYEARKMQEFLLQCVALLSLDIRRNVVIILILINTIFPTQKRHVLSYYDLPKTMVHVLKCERTRIKDHNQIGLSELSGSPFAAKKIVPSWQ